MKIFCLILCLLLLALSQQVVYAQQPLAQQAFTVFEQHCLDCHGEFGSYTDALLIKHANLIEDRAVIPGQPETSELYLRLLGDTDTGSQMPLGQEPLDSEEIATIRRWIEAGAPDWEAIPKPKRHFITTEAMLQSIQSHVTSLAAFDRSFARYFTLTHLYNAGASDDNLRAYRNALSKLVNSLSWGSEVIKPKPIDQAETIFYIDLRHFEWDVKSDKWYKIEQAYPYGVQLKSSIYTTLCEETNCELPFVRADWFIATASLPPLYHEILDLPKTDRELETRLEVNVAENLRNAPGVRVWRAGFNESGVSVNNRIVERHKSRYGAYWKSYDFAGNIGTQNIFTHPLNFTHDGGEIIFNLPNGLQAYYLSTATGERLDEAPINIVSDAGSRDPVVRNGLSCMGCHTEGMKTFEDQVRSVIEQSQNPSYDKAQALRLYAEKSEMNALIREDTERYRRALIAAGGVFGGSEPIQQLVKQFKGPLDAAHAAAEVGLETANFLEKVRGNSTLQNAGLLVLGVEKGTVKRDAWEAEFSRVMRHFTEVEPTLPKGIRTNPTAGMVIPETDMTKAKEVLAAAVEAHGGLEKLQAVKNIVVEGRATANSPMGQMQVESKAYYVYPDKFRQDMKLPQGEMGYVFDGTSGFALTPMGVQPLPPDVTNSFKDAVFRETIWLLTNLSQNEISVQYAGTEDVQGKSAHVLLVPQPSGETLRLFVSEETHYVVKIAYREMAQGVTANRESLMDDYRDVDGVKVAYHIVQNVDGQLFLESRVTGVTLNAELDDALF